jgi:pimeloyl-ACP methyl ester carboxylesterase
VLAEPARARASVSLYRTFLTREVGRARDGRLRVPTRIMLGAHDPAIPAVLLDGADDDAEDVCIEIVPECGHFVPEEHPISWLSAAASCSACVDQGLINGLGHTSSDCSQGI